MRKNRVRIYQPAIANKGFFPYGQFGSRVCPLAPDFHGSVGANEVEKRC